MYSFLFFFFVLSIYFVRPPVYFYLWFNNKRSFVSWRFHFMKRKLFNMYIYIHIYKYTYINTHIRVYIYRIALLGISELLGSSVSIERDEIRRSINKTNIHAFLKHYYYKYWLTPWQTPWACTRENAFGTFEDSFLTCFLILFVFVKLSSRNHSNLLLILYSVISLFFSLSRWRRLHVVRSPIRSVIFFFFVFD